jgi:putative FmdB family regulatory protein
MPLREYICRDCGHQFDEIVKHHEPDPACPHCSADGHPGRVERLISAHGGIKGDFGTVPKRNQGAYKKAAK